MLFVEGLFFSGPFFPGLTPEPLSVTAQVGSGEQTMSRWERRREKREGEGEGGSTTVWSLTQQPLCGLRKWVSVCARVCVCVCVCVYVCECNYIYLGWRKGGGVYREATTADVDGRSSGGVASQGGLGVVVT